LDVLKAHPIIQTEPSFPIPISFAHPVIDVHPEFALFLYHMFPSIFTTIGIPFGRTSMYAAYPSTSVNLSVLEV